MVVVTSFPFSSLLDQHRQVSVAQAQVSRLSSENRSLTVEARRLRTPAVVAAIARADFGFVKPGETAYDILPLPGAPSTSAITSGDVPLDHPPVAPGSLPSQELLDAGAAPPASGASGSAVAPRGLWSRIVHDLEFWR